MKLFLAGSCEKFCELTIPFDAQSTGNRRAIEDVCRIIGGPLNQQTKLYLESGFRETK